MSLTSANHGEQIGPHRGLAETRGFVANLFVLQKKLPRVIAGERCLMEAILVREYALTRRQKERILRVASHIWSTGYRRSLHQQKSPDDGDEDSTLLAFAHQLATQAPWVCRVEVERLRACGLDNAIILETILMVALGQLLCTLANALSADPDPAVPAHPSIPSTELLEPGGLDPKGPDLQPGLKLDSSFQADAFFREQFGFVPRLFQEQILRPDVVEAESQALANILIPEDLLSRVQKEKIVLVVSAANLNTYSVALHRQILATLGVALQDSDQIVEDHRCAAISPEEAALLGEVRKLACCSTGTNATFSSTDLRAQGFSEPHILEAIAVAAVANFLNTLQAGLGTVPEFPPGRVFAEKDQFPSSTPTDMSVDAAPREDPDAALVSRVQNGDQDAFEELVRRHSRRIFATLAGLLGNVDDARDVAQDVFLKAFEHMDRFEGRSKFSTWLTSIAINTGTELLRQRKPSESLDEGEADDQFRPRQIQSWADNPEQALAASQRADLVREGVLRLPQKYRAVVLLRDINQLSTEEVAVVLGLSIAAVKARLLRGRLMLRESLAPYFSRGEKGPENPKERS